MSVGGAEGAAALGAADEGGGAGVAVDGGADEGGADEGGADEGGGGAADDGGGGAASLPHATSAIEIITLAQTLRIRIPMRVCVARRTASVHDPRRYGAPTS